MQPNDQRVDIEKLKREKVKESPKPEIEFYSPLSQNDSLSASARPWRSSLFANVTTEPHIARKNLSMKIPFFVSLYDKLWLETPTLSCSDLRTPINAKKSHQGRQIIAQRFNAGTQAIANQQVPPGTAEIYHPSPKREQGIFRSDYPGEPGGINPRILRFTQNDDRLKTRRPESPEIDT